MPRLVYIKVEQITDEHLICHAFNHRMTPHAAQALKTVIGGARQWDWELLCSNCDSRRFEIRDDLGVRVPGTSVQYQLDPVYQSGCGYERSEYVAEIQHRQLFH